MCASVLSVHECEDGCPSWMLPLVVSARLYGKTGCTQAMSKMVLGNYSKEEPGQHSGTAGSAVCTMTAPGSHLGNPPQSRRKPEG